MSIVDDATKAPGSPQDDLRRYLGAKDALETTAGEVEGLEGSAGVETFKQQLDLLKRRLVEDPSSFRDLFIEDGIAAAGWEFSQPELSDAFVESLWGILTTDGDASTVFMRFIWDLPVGKKRSFIRGIDRVLSDRYPMLKGLSAAWPANVAIAPYIREADVRAEDFDLVNKGYLGYMDLGLTAREVDVLVWLEVLRDKQCEERPCELGKLTKGTDDRIGGCPVRIHIPEMINRIGNGDFRGALELIQDSNPLPDVTGRVCPQELQCQGSCILKVPMSIGQIEFFLPQREKLLFPDSAKEKFAGFADPWKQGSKPPIAIVGSGPSGLINAYLLAVEGYPVTVFEAFHQLGGVLRYGIPEFRLPNNLIDDVVEKIRLLGGKFVMNFVVGKTATLQDLRDAGFWKIFVGTGAGLPRFMNVPGEHLLNVMSANEFLTRVNLMQGLKEEFETPLPEIKGKEIIIIGGGNTAMDAARTSRRLGGNVTIVYRRGRSEMPARVEELHHALEEGIALKQLAGPTEFLGDDTGFVKAAIVDQMELGEPDASGRRAPISTGKTETIKADLVIMALGNASNPIIKDSEPRLETSKWGTINVKSVGSQETSLKGIYTGGDAQRGGSTAVNAAGDGQSAAREILGDLDVPIAEVPGMVSKAHAYTERSLTASTIVAKRQLSDGIVEFTVRSPVIADHAKAGQFVRVLPWDGGELIPLTLADWDAKAGTICLVIQGMGTSSILMNKMEVGETLAGIAGPLGLPSHVERYPEGSTVVFTAGGLGLPPVYPIAREHLELGNHVTLIAGFRSENLMFWVGEGERVTELKAKYGDLLDVVYATNDGTIGYKGFVTGPLEEMLEANKAGKGRTLAEIVTIGPPFMMRAVSDLSKPYGVKCVASLNSIMVDATGMCGACMVPVEIDGKPVRKHACIDGPELDSHIIDWDKFLPRFNLFKSQEKHSMDKRGLSR